MTSCFANLKIFRPQIVALALGTALLTSCGGGDKSAETPASDTAVETPAVVNPLEAAVAGEWRDKDKARDQFRNPKETLEFFEIAPGMDVVEIWPGWYTEILAPYAKETGGTYTAALYDPVQGDWVADRTSKFKDKFSNAEIYGDVKYTTFYKTGLGLADNSTDYIVTFRNLHNWMGQGFSEQAMAEFYRALKPGGRLGIVEHRLPESAQQDVRGRTGYVQESYTKALAEVAGFEFVGSSEVNANPNDTADHPFGVWTLPPRSRTPKDDDPELENFDAAKYKAIGESDRFTMIFKKPE